MVEVGKRLGNKKVDELDAFFSSRNQGTILKTYDPSSIKLTYAEMYLKGKAQDGPFIAALKALGVLDKEIGIRPYNPHELEL